MHYDCITLGVIRVAIVKNVGRFAAGYNKAQIDKEATMPIALNLIIQTVESKLVRYSASLD